MPFDFIKFAFSAGELSEDLHGRGDLEGFKFGYREGLNVLVDWRGGLRTRPGTLMCEPLFESADNPGVRLSTFSFNADPEDNYLLVWLHERLRIVQEARYLEEETEIAGNAMTAGDVVRVYDSSDSYLFTGKAKDADTVYVPYKSQEVNLTASNTVKKVVEINTPFQDEDIHDLRFEQFRDQVIISHTKYSTRVLERTLSGDDVTFAVVEQPFRNSRILTGKASTERDRPSAFADNTGGFHWTTALVDDKGREYPVPYSDAKLETSVNIGEKYLDLNWDGNEEAETYRVYGSSFKPGFNEVPTPVTGSRSLVRNSARDLSLTSGIAGATFFDGKIWIVENTGTVTLRSFGTDGSQLSSRSFSAVRSAVLNNGTHIVTVSSSDNLVAAFSTSSGNPTVSSLDFTLPSANWSAGEFAAGFLLFMDNTNDRIAKVDPVQRTVDSYIDNWPSNDYRAIVSDGTIIWAGGVTVGKRVMYAYSIELEAFITSLNLNHGLSDLAGAFHIESLDEVHLVRSGGATVAYDLVAN